MKDIQVGSIVMSMAGRDKGNYYIVVSKQKGFVDIVDGYAKTIEKPKKKNIKHLQLVYKNCNLLFKNMHNCDIIYTIKNYKSTSKKLLEE